MASGEGSKKLKLYSYWRSSCSCRVRIALKLKGLDYDYIAVNLLKGEQKSPEFLELNPLGQYLEKKYPQHPLLPQDPQKEAVNYQAADIVCANIQPFQNIPIIGYIKEKLGPDEMLAWVQGHIRKGFSALEKLLETYAGKYATGDEVYLADLFLAPQIDGAIRRFNLDMDEFPILSRINVSYKEHTSFQDAMPGKQPDTPPEAMD